MFILKYQNIEPRFDTWDEMNEYVQRRKFDSMYYEKGEYYKWARINLFITMYGYHLDKLHDQGCNVYIKTDAILGESI